MSMNDMDKVLLDETKKYGVNASMYNMLPQRQRESALRKDIDRAKARVERKEPTDGQN